MPQIKPRSSMERRQFLKDVGVAGAAAVGSAAISNPPSVTADTVPSNRYMRSPENAPKYSRGPLPLPEVGIIALNRMGFGPRPGDLDDFNALGATDEERLNNYIEQQLDPDSIDDSVYEARQASAGFTTLSKSREQLWTEYLRGNQPTSLPMQELERLTFLRAIYSKKQLQEVLYDFWFNHFNVYGWQYAVSSMIRNYDRIIRTHMFGNFREMLEEITRSTTMLYYLDNYTNSREGPNENFARELFELHTLGAENYYGVMPQDDVPPDPSDPNLPAGYVDEDVYEATRCFTGWTVANSSNGPGGDTGLFLYRDDWHDRFQKRVLAYSNNIPSDQAAEQDGEDVLDMVAFHPGTARYICRKLCTRLISDNPPEQLVEDTAAFFMLHKDTGNQLKRVVRFILQSEAFRTTWGEKVKRPFEIIVGVMRATEADFTIRMDHSDSNTFLAYYDNIGPASLLLAATERIP